MVKNVLEIFAGSCSFSKVAKEFNYNTYTIDNQNLDNIDFIGDFMDFDYKKLNFIPDIIWASPPCYTFSMAGISHHFKKHNGVLIPISEASKKSLKLIDKTIEIILYFKKLNNDLVFFIENPIALMRKLPQLKHLPYQIYTIRKSVNYCQYGHNYMKPTDIFTNLNTWIPKKRCKNGMNCHEASPRGSRTGINGNSSKYDKSIVPKDLCIEIIKSYEKTY
tara:strand:- start:809 stop:1468 length:660 start_codon:yes stop_codon:yes gene_type:complete